MSTSMSVLAVTALTGSAVIGGVFFAFSSFIMKSLSRSGGGVRTRPELSPGVGELP